MDTTATKLIGQLRVADIRERLDELQSERQALLVLLRAALAAERKTRKASSSEATR